MADRMMTPREVAELLQVGRRSVRQALTVLGCPVVRISTTEWRVRRADLEAAIQAATTRVAG